MLVEKLQDRASVADFDIVAVGAWHSRRSGRSLGRSGRFSMFYPENLTARAGCGAASRPPRASPLSYRSSRSCFLKVSIQAQTRRMDKRPALSGDQAAERLFDQLLSFPDLIEDLLFENEVSAVDAHI